MKKIFSFCIISLFLVFSSCTDFADIFEEQGKTSSSKQARVSKKSTKKTAKKTTQKPVENDDSDYEREVDHSDTSDEDEVKVVKKTTPKKENEPGKTSEPSVDDDGVSKSALGFIWPVKGNIISGFGRRGSRDHDGLDIKAPKGTPVYSSKKGTVIFADVRSGYGNLVIIRHDENYFSVYAHLDKILVKKGKVVKQNELIGKVGQTGRATTPHLHFEIRYKTDPKDPVLYLPKKS